MNLLLTLSAAALAGFATLAAPAARKTLYDFSARSIDGQEVPLSQYKGKKVLIVNVASQCGYTPQYAELEQLSKKYAGKLVILGFPANDFGQQEPGSNTEIKSFCQKNYGVTFQMMEKVSVVGADACPLYQWLASKEQNGVQEGAPQWNFTKYLIDESGNLVHRFDSRVKPMGDEIKKAMEG